MFHAKIISPQYSFFNNDLNEGFEERNSETKRPSNLVKECEYDTNGDVRIEYPTNFRSPIELEVSMIKAQIMRQFFLHLIRDINLQTGRRFACWESIEFECFENPTFIRVIKEILAKQYNLPPTTFYLIKRYDGKVIERRNQCELIIDFFYAFERGLIFGDEYQIFKKLTYIICPPYKEWISFSLLKLEKQKEDCITKDIVCDPIVNYCDILLSACNLINIPCPIIDFIEGTYIFTWKDHCSLTIPIFTLQVKKDQIVVMLKDRKLTFHPSKLGKVFLVINSVK